MILLLLKVTLLLAVTLLTASAMRRSSASLRHLICVCGLLGALLLPLALLVPPDAAVFHISAVSVPTTARLTPRTPAIALSLLWLWVAGTALLLGRLALGYIRLAWIVRNAEAGPGVLYADVSVPVAVGLFRPVILLPRDAEHWPRDRWDAALRHERAHLRRHDLLTLLIANLACAAYWFHPLVWACAALLRREQEQAADDAVIHSGLSPASYAEALLAVAQNLDSTKLIGCHMLTQNTFRSRVARLLTDGLPRVTSNATLRCAATSFAVAVAVLAIGLVNGKAHGQSPDTGTVGPKVISRVNPEYSLEARKAKYSGVVTLLLTVGVDGLAHDINVVKSLGLGLDEAAVRAIQSWRFEPARKDGEPVEAKTQVDFNFRLE